MQLLREGDIRVANQRSPETTEAPPAPVAPGVQWLLSLNPYMRGFPKIEVTLIWGPYYKKGFILLGSYIRGP